MNSPLKKTKIKAPLWVWAFGLVSTIFAYKSGISDQIEQIPIIIRMLDGDYLKNDFFVNASEGFGPRYYYAHFVAFIARLGGIPGALFLLTLLANTGIALVSFQAGSSLFPKVKHAGLLASALAISVPIFEMGSDLSIYGNYLTPGLLISPLILAAIWKGWEGKYLLAAVLAGIASIFHVLYGLETGLLVLAACFFQNIIQKNNRGLLKIVGSGAILWAFSLITLLPYLQLEKTLTNEEFIEILAYFRHPHHYLPSHFFLKYQNILPALLSLLVLWKAWGIRKQRLPEGRNPANWLLMFGTFLFLSLFAGWIMVEVFPSRLFATAQLWRLLNLYKWIFLILVGGSLGILMEKANPFEKAYILLSQIHIFPLLFLHGIASKTGKIRPPFRGWFSMAISLLAAYLLVLFMDLPITVLLMSFLFAAWLIAIVVLPKIWGRMVLAAVVVFTLAQLTFLPGALPPAISQHSNKILKPQILTPDYPEEVMQMAKIVKEQTFGDAVILSPPGFGGLRIVGERALVVDFKAFPFGDQAIREWHERVGFFYGWKPGYEFESMDKQKEVQVSYYKNVAPQLLNSRHDAYPFDYAILDTATSEGKEIGRAGSWKLVSFQGIP